MVISGTLISAPRARQADWQRRVRNKPHAYCRRVDYQEWSTCGGCGMLHCCPYPSTALLGGGGGRGVGHTRGLA